MIRILFIVAFIFGLIVSISGFPNGAIATGIAGILTMTTVFAIGKIIKDKQEKFFILQIFLGGLLVRLILGFTIYTFNLEKYFGPDAFTYNSAGILLSECWWSTYACPSLAADNWGMMAFTGIIYSFAGINPLAVQFISAVCGALTAVFTYFLAYNVFLNKQVARYSAFLVAFFPAMIIWSSQMLKDGFIIFLLVIIMISVIKLQKELNYWNIFFLIVGLLGILSLRFYIFYMVMASVIGGLFLGANISLENLLKRAGALLILAIVFLYVGIQQTSTKQLEALSLERVERIRNASSDRRLANSGIEDDTDVSTVTGAISALPVGVVTILLAPFPWQMRSVTQLLTLPEMLIWWGMFPFLYIGIRYIISYRLRESVTMFFFSLILLLAYSIYQGNIGTLYRQRTQIQIFLLIFVAVGYTVRREKTENRQLKNQMSLKSLSYR